MPCLESTRRMFLGGAAAALAYTSQSAFGRTLPLRIGVTDWNLNLEADPESVPRAAHLGFQGIQISFGRNIVDGKMTVDSPEVIARYRRASQQFRIPIDGTCVARLHDNGLKSDPLASKWVLDAIRLTKDLNARVLLLPFFGPWAIKTPGEIEHIGDVVRDLAPEAEKAEVTLGLEDTISAEDNVRIMERSRSKNVLVYYDVGNSTKAGFDVVKEIRWLGKDRICQFHFKDNPHYLGEGTIQFAPVVQAIKDIGWNGWGNLETDARPGSLDADMRRNLTYMLRIVDRAYA